MQASATTSSLSSHGLIFISKQPPNPLAAVWGCNQASVDEELLFSGRLEDRKKVHQLFYRTAENAAGTGVATRETRLVRMSRHELHRDVSPHRDKVGRTNYILLDDRSLGQHMGYRGMGRRDPDGS
ncbi:hypothetical protein Taro_033349 [Colocasia esculenta]|uniref:Uncharacterized protein n=1 Tax=Colocasia esculenta TaxID=4460 RepID=A0A843W4I2_COLES|nr:hypothetical protein [Colocasia esculenta]